MSIKKFLVLLILYILSKNMFANNFMMNCMSPDYKSAVFYKYIKNEKQLFSRTVKKKWENFCQKNIEDEEKKIINCTFNELILKRSETFGNEINYIKKTSFFNFSKYTLKEKTETIKNKVLKGETENIFKCRKIKI